MSDITPMAAVPSEVNYGRIRANFVAFIADDNGNVLEELPLEGNVILTPTVGVLRFPSTSPPRTAVIQTLQCPVIGGILYPPGTPLGGPFPSQTGVAAVASDQPAGLPTTVQWTASFSLENTSAQPNPVTFNVPANGVVDLTTVMPATPTPGTVVVVSTETAERAELAADTATQRASEAASSATAAATSATAADSSATASQTARDTTLAAAILELRGEGQPGSSAATIDALPGTYYTDVLGTAGAWRWLKTSPGSGVAQWDVVHGDTGLRQIDSILEPGWSINHPTRRVYLRRVGDLVVLTGLVNAPPSEITDNRERILLLPPGLRPHFTSNYYVGQLVEWRATSTPNSYPTYMGNLGGNRYLMSDTAGYKTYAPAGTLLTLIGMTWTTNDDWPTTLPGTPA